MLKNAVTGRNYQKPYRTCVYKGLSEYIERNNISFSKLNRAIGAKGNSTNPIALKLKGMRDFKIKEIKKILEFTGMTFEECFALKESVTSDGE